ncbi:monooxygenase [Pectobacterium betavasculorum]|uniref:Monooxygenase n=1 Tax=Pectobacterium betavasculorum TaxID=55207 RepID=A0A093RPZ7_9GAMM|nr:acyl-CoA dehydrogenase family protein [Pectobacterium betavasculorum]KFW99905.1 monooxygenase [Pectobacterium betavasculorum]KFX13875.1 monooxygenase [Pectobacterium betavasculorum]
MTILKSEWPAVKTKKPAADELLTVAKQLAACLSVDAPERDRQGGTPTQQIAMLKHSGLLKTMIPTAWGGYGHSWSTVLGITREFAKVDGSIAHLFGYHSLVMNLPHLGGNTELNEQLQRSTAENDWIWGNAVSSLSPTLMGETQDGGYVLNGFRPFSSGSHVADRLYIGWDDRESGKRHYAVIPADRSGVEIVGDWDGFGQTQTGSGSVRFHDVLIFPEERVEMSTTKDLAMATLLPQMSQSVLSSVFIGSALGALEAARHYTMTQSRPWVDSGFEAHYQDPWVQRVYGELWTQTEAASLLVEKADRALDDLWRQGEVLSFTRRGEQARVIASANVFAGKVALEATSAIFEVMGARSATRSHGFDRFWRNVRVHTLHNPTEYKVRNVGLWFLTGHYPEPRLYV